MTLDELLLEWSYKSEKGYPSLDNPSDISVLKKILEDLNLPSNEIIKSLKEQSTDEEDIIDDLEDLPSEEEPSEEEPEDTGEKDEDDELSEKPGGSKEYDDVIKAKLGVDVIPTSKHKYKFQQGTFDEQVKSDDLKTWQDLWEAKPEKKTEPGVETAGVGKGEMSLYWLYHYSNSGINADEGRNDDDPDLYFNGNGVEVKSYDGKSNSVIGLGRFGKDRENINLLNIAFGIKVLASVLDENVKDKKATSALTWGGKDLESAFEEVYKFLEIDLEQLSEVWPIFQNIKDKIDSIEQFLGKQESPKKYAEAMARKFLGDKLSRKPGWGKHLVNIERNGFMRFWHVTEERLDAYDDLLGKAVLGASQGAMKVHFNKVFGS